MGGMLILPTGSDHRGVVLPDAPEHTGCPRVIACGFLHLSPCPPRSQMPAPHRLMEQHSLKLRVANVLQASCPAAVAVRTQNNDGAVYGVYTNKCRILPWVTTYYIYLGDQ